MAPSPTRSARTKRYRSRAVATAAASVVLMLAGVSAPAVAAPRHGVPPVVVQHWTARHPGDLLSVRSLALRSYPGTKAWSITYRSTSATGKPDVVSGAVIAPVNATATTPIVAYAPGTLGLGDQCAQSRNLDTDLNSERTFIQKYTTLRYAVAITDYEGLGTPGKHTYNVGRSEGHAVLDVVRAAQRLPGAHLSGVAPVAVVGYSQGGFAAGWAAELAPTYAPEMNLKGAAAGAPPANLAANLRYLDGTLYAGLELAAVYGQDAAYPNLHLTRYLNAKGRAAFKQIATECVDDLTIKLDGTVSKWAGHKLSEYTTENFLNRPDWRASVHKSLLGTLTPEVPVLLYISPADDVVPYATVARLRDAWRRHGANVTFYAPNTGGHELTGGAMEGVATGWISARLLGLPTSARH